MRFMFFFYPALAATLEERKRMRPIARHTEPWQKMFEEVAELSRMAEDLGFEAVTFPEHHLHTEGAEMGSLPILTQYVINQTKRIKVGPIGYVLPGWNPLRLALEIAWLDQLTKGRTFVGFARGYQARWLNSMAQKLHIGASAISTMQEDIDARNREAFEEVYQILKLAWADGPFRFKGKHYEYPSPYETGTPWPAHQWTREYGAPGEVDDNGNVQMIEVVPKPYQKPHPMLFQAFSMSEATIRWAAREGLIPTLLASEPKQVRYYAEAHVDEAKKHGRNLRLGENMGVFRSVYLADSHAEAKHMGDVGLIGVGWQQCFHHFGFTEAFRFPEDDVKYPNKQLLPASECTTDRLEKAHFALVGTTSDIRREMDLLVETANPEWFIWQSDQGYLPLAQVKLMLQRFGKEILPHYV